MKFDEVTPGFGWRADAARKVVVFADPQQGQNAAVSYTPGATFQVRRADNDAAAFTGSVAAWRGGRGRGDGDTTQITTRQ